MTKTKSQKARARQAKQKNPFAGPARKRKSPGRRQSAKASKDPWADLPKSAQPLRADPFGLSNPFSAPVMTSVATKNTGPNWTGSGRGAVRVRHREFIGNIIGSSAFTVQFTFPVNPGIATTFPWLSDLATNFEQYKLHACKFIYISRCATSVPGSCMLIPDYDAADGTPMNEYAASTYEGVVECPPYTSKMELTLDPVAMNQPADRKYIRSGRLAANLDIKTYDAANAFVATVDGTSVNWGKLWVEYDCELFKPTIAPGVAADTYSALYNNAGTGVTTTSLMGTNANLWGAGNLSSSGTTITVYNLPVGAFFKISYYVAGTATTAAGNTASAVSGCQADYNWSQGANGGGTVGVQSVLMANTFQATASTAVITWAVLSTCTTPIFAQMELIVNYAGQY